MKITILIENTSCFPDLRKEKGLSLYISTDNHRILFDCGMGDGFIKNAEKLATDLREVDIAFISHGHYDHGGGIEEFLKINKKAPIYIQKSTFGKYYAQNNAKRSYGGLNQKLVTNTRFDILDGTTIIDNGLQIISGVPPKKEIKNLLMEKNGEFLPDIFEHEQSLIISENGIKVLVSGCSHCGIDQIVHTANNVCGKINYILGGFHLISYDFNNPVDLAEIDTLANRLLAEEAMCYTCHCTSIEGYGRLKRTMGEHIGYLSSGNTIVI